MLRAPQIYSNFQRPEVNVSSSKMLHFHHYVTESLHEIGAHNTVNYLSLSLYLSKLYINFHYFSVLFYYLNYVNLVAGS